MRLVTLRAIVSVPCLILNVVDVLTQYALTILSDTPKQIIGDYTLTLNDYHVKAPYAHMAETCPSLPPDYTRDATC
jgi:hypothetical protein